MVLAVDIGNTNTCIGGLDGQKILFSTRMVTRPRCTEDEYTAELKFLLERLAVDLSACTGVIVCSVVPALTGVLARACRRLTGCEAFFVRPGPETGLIFDYENPERLGQDRIADAAAACALYPLPCMTVDLGTATTFNVVDASRTFRGGFISPGVLTSLRAVSAGTAQLPPIAPETADHLIGRSTVECLNNAAIFGTAAMVDGLADRVEQELNQPLAVVLTGGLSPCIIPCCRRKIIYEPDLLFRGLAVLYESASTAK